jgi:hypothetical protein
VREVCGALFVLGARKRKTPAGTAESGLVRSFLYREQVA